MLKPLSHRTLAVVAAITLGVGAVVSGQMGAGQTGSAQTGSAQTAVATAPRGTLEELLAEVRGLRADMRRASDTSFRAQLLIARLEVQEQRINTLTRQLIDAQRQMSDNERGRSAMAGQLATFEREMHKASPAEREEFEQVLGPLKAQIKALEKLGRDLEAQQTSINNLIAEEQTRWTSFNVQLEELGRALEPKPLR